MEDVDGHGDDTFNKSLPGKPKKKKKSPMLIQVLNEEARYTTTRAQLDHLENLQRCYQFAIQAKKAASALSAACQSADMHIDVEPFFKYSAFETEVKFYGVTKTNRIPLGGLRNALYHEMKSRASAWLHNCERSLCLVNEEECVPNEMISRVIDDIASSIAARTISREVDPFCSIDHLSSAYFESQIKSAVARSSHESETSVRLDCMCLRTLEKLAEGENLKGMRIVLTDELRNVMHIIDSPPPELALERHENGVLGQEEGRTGINFGLLRRALCSNDPIEVRLSIARVWARQHGAFARTSIKEALRLLGEHDGGKPAPFADVVVREDIRNGVPLPEAKFMPSVGRWHVVPVSRKKPRRRLGPTDAEGRRIVRIVRMTWTIMAHAEIRRGLYPAQVAFTVALQAQLRSEYMLNIVDGERKLYNLGCRTVKFKEALNDFSSYIADDVNQMMCELSRFTFHDIIESFNCEGRHFHLAIGPLTMRTLALLGNPKLSSSAVPYGYLNFVQDALGCVLPPIWTRRQSIDAGFYKPANPFGDLVRSVREVHSWAPIDGSFSITLPMLKRAHPNLRRALDHYAVQPNAFVRKAPSHSAVSYTFDTATLLRIVRA